MRTNHPENRRPAGGDRLCAANFSVTCYHDAKGGTDNEENELFQNNYFAFPHVVDVFYFYQLFFDQFCDKTFFEYAPGADG